MYFVILFCKFVRTVLSILMIMKRSVILLLAFVAAFVSCRQEIQDTAAPTITIIASEVNVIGGVETKLETSQLVLGAQVVASWKDDVTKKCKATVSVDGREIPSGTSLSEAGKLTLSVSDDAGNTATSEIVLIRKDMGAPQITVLIPEKNVIAGATVTIKDDQLLFDEDVAARWSDDFTSHCSAVLTFKPDGGDAKEIKSGTAVSEPGTLTLTVSDEAGNASSADIKLLTVDKTAPQISVLIEEKNVIAGPTVIVESNYLMFDKQVAAEWSDDFTETCTTALSFIPTNGTARKIVSGNTLSEAGILEITVTDDGGNSSSASIVLTADAIYGLESIGQLQLMVDEEVDLLKGISFPKDVQLMKVEIVMDEKRTEIPDPTHYLPEYPGKATIIFSVQIENDTILGIESQPLDIIPLNMPGYSIAQAAIGDGWEGVSTGYSSFPTKKNFEVTGVFKAWALIREMAEHGTRDASASEIRTRLSRHQPVVFGEHPKAVDDIVWAGGIGGNWKEEHMTVHFDEECFFMCPDISDKIRNDWEIGADSHGQKITGILYITIYPVLHALGTRIGFIGTQIPVEHDESTIRSYYAYDGLKEELEWTMSHPETILYHTESTYFGSMETYVPQLVVQPNMGLFMCSLGNTYSNAARTCYFITKNGEDCPEYVNDTHAWSYGAEGALGGWNNGETHVTVPPTIGHTMLPVESHKNDDDIWCESSQIQGWGGNPTTSPASPAAMGKFYLASLLNYALNPNLSVHENKRQIREVCLDHYVYYGDDLYMIGKRINPGGIVEKYFSTLPASVPLSSEELIPLPLGVFPHCVVIGPGVVDAEGTPVTEDNYLEMVGKQLYISPVLLRKYGVASGSRLKYTEHLCLDRKGTGIGNPSEGGKSICSRVTVMSAI